MLIVCRFSFRYLNRGSMFVFSQEQFKTLMDLDDSCRDASLLDLGAGDGTVTQTMAKYFKTVFATESSPTMKTRLSEKGFMYVGLGFMYVGLGFMYVERFHVRRKVSCT